MCEIVQANGGALDKSGKFFKTPMEDIPIVQEDPSVFDNCKLYI